MVCGVSFFPSFVCFCGALLLGQDASTPCLCPVPPSPLSLSKLRFWWASFFSHVPWPPCSAVVTLTLAMLFMMAVASPVPASNSPPTPNVRRRPHPRLQRVNQQHRPTPPQDIHRNTPEVSGHATTLTLYRLEPEPTLTVLGPPAPTWSATYNFQPYYVDDRFLLSCLLPLTLLHSLPPVSVTDRAFKPASDCVTPYLSQTQFAPPSSGRVFWSFGSDRLDRKPRVRRAGVC